MALLRVPSSSRLYSYLSMSMSFHPYLYLYLIFVYDAGFLKIGRPHNFSLSLTFQVELGCITFGRFSGAFIKSDVGGHYFLNRI